MKFIIVFIGIASIITANKSNVMSTDLAIVAAYFFGMTIGTWNMIEREKNARD